jgi:putative transposase
MNSAMSIVKIEIKMPELVKTVDQFKKNRLQALEQITNEFKLSISKTFSKILEAELELFLGQDDQVNNKKNGYYEKEYSLKNIGAIKIKVPKDRQRKFSSSIIPKKERMDPRLKEDLAVLHLAGISNRTLALISKRILGVQVSTQTIQDSLSIIEEQALSWLDRDITEDYWALYIDGTNFRIQRRGSTEKEPTLVVLGIDNSNRMSILSLQPGHKDQASDWEHVFEDLSKRGLNSGSVRIGIMDGLPGLEKTFKQHYVNATSARCWVHAKKNILSKVPSRLQEPFSQLLNKVMYADGKNNAVLAFEKLKKEMNTDAVRAIKCLEKDLKSLLVHYDFDKTLWRCLKTTNPIERVNKELKRRTKVMEGVGEKTLNILLAFTALRLEYNWRKVPVDSATINNLKNVNKENQIEDTLEKLIPKFEN